MRLIGSAPATPLPGRNAMRTLLLVPVLAPLLCALLCAPLANAAPVGAAAPAPVSATVVTPAPADVVGGDHYFFCAAGQTIKIVGLFTGNAGLVLVGAVGGGLACGFGL
jgi:hypothetical protein